MRAIFFLKVVVFSLGFILITFILKESLFAVEFNAGFLKDPFIPDLPEPELKQPELKQPELKQPETKVVPRQEIIQPPLLIVQGMVWGSKLPKAIIENKVLGIGDEIKEAKIVEIKREGVVISYKSQIFTLQPPAPSLDKKPKR